MMYKLYIQTEYGHYNAVVNNYKFKNDFLTLNMANGKKIVFNVNKVEMIEMEEVIK